MSAFIFVIIYFIAQFCCLLKPWHCCLTNPKYLYHWQLVQTAFIKQKLFKFSALILFCAENLCIFAANFKCNNE